MDNVRGRIRPRLVGFDADVDTSEIIRIRCNSLTIIGPNPRINPEVVKLAMLSQVSSIQ
jgi:hypothetical protein